MICAMKKIILSVLAIVFLASGSVLRAENIGVPAQSEDVMLQAFYWDSYKTQAGSDSKYGRTKWVDIRKDSVAICGDFDLVWFPPSAFGDGGDGKGGVGYIPKNFTDQTSDWGQASTLDKLIATMHNNGAKVIADIVINHHGNYTSWCSFFADNFGQYGSFQLTSEHICRNDEVNSTKDAGSCKGAATGANDTGTNFEGARDLDHTNEYVQNWSKAYLKWMLGVMHYDGFRYDMTLGYRAQYLKSYNEATNPYISVSEYWEGIDKQVSHLQAMDYNTMIFDFPLKYVLNNALGKYSNYRLLVSPNNSLRGKGYGKYAVTFIDNHDTFERSDNQSGEFIKYNANLKDATNKSRILQANAYILMLPGVPCVFYPHWKSYQEEISALIKVRKTAGIHSESAIEESSENNVYEAKVQGHRGSVIFRLGPNRSTEAPEGYTLALEGGDVAPYTIFYKEGGQGIEDVQGDNVQGTKGVKFMKDGKLYIRVNDEVYTILGEKIQ